MYSSVFHGELTRSVHKKKMRPFKKARDAVPHEDTPGFFLLFVCCRADTAHAWHIVSTTKAKTTQAEPNSYLEKVVIVLMWIAGSSDYPEGLSTLNNIKHLDCYNRIYVCLLSGSSTHLQRWEWRDFSSYIFQGWIQTSLVLRRNCFHYSFSNSALSHSISVIG